LLLPVARAKGHADAFESTAASSSDDEVAAALQMMVGGVCLMLMLGQALGQFNPALAAGAALFRLCRLHVKD
jgi:hypothetical protein